ncbi:MAG: tripartite tricarboxylate transporter substrate binding protein [Burkholderiales bacterium]|nr:tripartite tricarboxylate transporter substrate binding protein [Burkholderiales bacterium]MDP2397577.1 tripartite tricarboxylate transporter substrate binding protein [Burkholderiales bacterium]
MNSNCVIRRAPLLAVVAVTTWAISPALQAQNYPSKPVRVIVAWPPGGANDIAGRIVAQKLTENTGQQFIIDNRGGASGILGSDVVAKSAADGYTILVHSATHMSNPHLYSKVPYDTLKDFVGVSPLGRQVGMLVVHPSLPVKTVKEFIELGRKRPNEITYSSSGNGSFVHLAMALINSMSKTQMVHVPYKGGGPAAVAISSGEVQAMTATVGSVIPHINSKRLRPVAVTSEDRITQYPDVPAIAETIKGYEFTAWVGTFAPANTPKAIVDRLNAEIQKAMKDKGVADRLGAQTLDPMFMTPEQFAARLKSDYDKYGKLIRETGAKAG